MSVLSEHAGYDYQAQPKRAVNCLLCGKENPSIPAIDRYRLRVGMSACACGFRYLNPVMTPEAYAAFYAGPYRALVAAYRGREVSPEAFINGQQWYGRKLAEALPDVPRTGRWLDAGGGVGGVAEGMGAEEITVLDPCESDVDAARNRWHDGICATLEEFRGFPVYDVILCAQTIDHCYDPLLALRNLRAATRTEGWLIIDYVDCAQNLSAKQGRLMIERHPPLKIDHPCYWTKATMARALIETGWVIQRHVDGWCDKKGLFVCLAS